MTSGQHILNAWETGNKRQSGASHVVESRVGLCRRDTRLCKDAKHASAGSVILLKSPPTAAVSFFQVGWKKETILADIVMSLCLSSVCVCVCVCVCALAKVTYVMISGGRSPTVFTTTQMIRGSVSLLSTHCFGAFNNAALWMLKLPNQLLLRS